MAISFDGIPCPKCGRKGLHLRAHPHATGFHDVTKAECRFCHEIFNNNDTMDQYVHKVRLDDCNKMEVK